MHMSGCVHPIICTMSELRSTAGTPAAGLEEPLPSDHRAHRLQAVYALRCWMQQYPELFGTRIQADCFIVIGMLTTHSGLIPSLKELYGRLSYAENSVRNHLRSLAAGGWISFIRAPGGDRRSIGVRVDPPLARVFDEYFALLARVGQTPPSGTGPAPEECITGVAPRISP